MHVMYWPVDAASGSKAQALAMTTDDICDHLLVDWIPDHPIAKTTSFIGWPKYLVLPTENRRSWLALSKVTARMERQWKGVMSWMLGVAGARHALAEEGYRWIAPLSAFYEEASQRVATQVGGAPFQPGQIKVKADPTSKVRERPDFIVSRPSRSTQGYELALAESKGTSSQLRTKACDDEWLAQARNAIVTMKAGGRVVRIPRHLVIATRVNPNAKGDLTRALQIRAWEATAPAAVEPAPEPVLIDLVGAHMHGVLQNAELYSAAEAVSDAVATPLAEGVRKRSEAVRRSTAEQARGELDSLPAEATTRGASRRRVRRREIALPEGRGLIEIDDALIELARTYASEPDPERLRAAIARADARLDESDEEERRARPADRSSTKVGAGVTLKIVPR